MKTESQVRLPWLAPALSLALHGVAAAAALTLRGDARPPAPAAHVAVAVVTPEALATPRAGRPPEPAPPPAPVAAPAPTPGPAADPRPNPWPGRAGPGRAPPPDRPPPAPPKPRPASETAAAEKARAAPAAPAPPSGMRPPPGSAPAARAVRAAPAAPPAAPPAAATAVGDAAAAERREAPRYQGAGLANPAPRYPWFARRRGQEGRVVLRVRVGPDGAAEAVSIHRSSGYRLLDEAAAAAVGAWRFAPARQDGRPVPGSVDVPVSFRLTGPGYR